VSASEVPVAVVRESWPELHGSANDREMIDRIEHVLAVLRGKWKVQLLFLMARGIHRHGRLLVCLPGVSKKVMTDTLRSLEHDGLVSREVFAEMPARVEYSLTPLGWAITEPLVALAEWGEVHGPEVQASRARARKQELERPPAAIRPEAA
jgi:DNA-binding HxlR family transcriptional regulator